MVNSSGYKRWHQVIKIKRWYPPLPFNCQLIITHNRHTIFADSLRRGSPWGEAGTLVGREGHALGPHQFCGKRRARKAGEGTPVSHWRHGTLAA